MRKFLLINTLLVPLLLQGCNTAKFWNGYYSMQASTREYKKERDAYYAKETPEQKKLRKINEKICDDVSGAYSGNWDQILYQECMKKRGSPVF